MTLLYCNLFESLREAETLSRRVSASVDFASIPRLRRTTHWERDGLRLRGSGPGLGAIWRVVVMPHSVRQVLRRRVGFACLLAPTRSLATILLAREFVGDGGEQWPSARDARVSGGNHDDCLTAGHWTPRAVRDGVVGEGRTRHRRRGRGEGLKGEKGDQRGRRRGERKSDQRRLAQRLALARLTRPLHAHTNGETPGLIGVPRRYALVDSDNGDGPVKSLIRRMRAKYEHCFQKRNRECVNWKWKILS